MIIGTIRFLHLSPREGDTIERHFGLSARHFSLAPAGYYRQQGTKTGQELKRDRNQFGTGTNRDKEPKPAGDFTAKGNHSLRCSNRCSIEASQDRGGITLHRSEQAKEPKATGTIGKGEPSAKGNHRQGEPKATGTKFGNGNHDFSSSTSRLFPLPYFLGALKPASVFTPYGDQLNFKSCRLPKRGDSPGPGPLLERCPGFLDSPALW
jgi:hypothetical protein